MGKVKQVLIEIAELAADKIESWCRLQPDDFYAMEPEERADVIEEDLPEFFEIYGDDLAAESSWDGNEFRDFVGGHAGVISDMIVEILS
jgi:hypothetical protein